VTEEEPATPRSRKNLKWFALTAVAFFAIGAWWGQSRSTRPQVHYTCTASLNSNEQSCLRDP